MRRIGSIGVAVALMACGVEGSGDPARETREVGVFDAVDANNGVRVEIRVGAVATARTRLFVEADDNLLHRLSTDVSDGELEVDVDGPVQTRTPMFVGAEVSDLVAVRANNGADVDVQGISTGRFEVDANNGADVRLQGRGGVLAVEARNGGTIDATALEVEDAYVEIRNGGHVRLCATGSVGGDVSTGGSLEVTCGGDVSALGGFAGRVDVVGE